MALASTLATLLLACSPDTPSSDPDPAPATSDPTDATDAPTPLSPSTGRAIHDACGLAVTTQTVATVSCSGRIVVTDVGMGTTAEADLGETNAEARALHDVAIVARTTTGSGAPAKGQLVRIADEEAVQVPINESVAPIMDLATDGVAAVAVTIHGEVLSVEDVFAEVILTLSEPLVRVDVDAERLALLSETGTVTLVGLDGGDPIDWTSKGRIVAGDIAIVGEQVWVATQRGLYTHDPRDGSSRRLPVPGTITRIERCGDDVWVSQPRMGGEIGGNPGVRRLARDGTVRQEYETPDSAPYLACLDGHLWALTIGGELLPPDRFHG